MCEFVVFEGVGGALDGVAEVVDECSVEFGGDFAVFGFLHEDELAGVVELGDEFAADGEDGFVEGHVHAGTSVGCPVSDGVGAELVDEGHRGDDDAFGFGHLFAVGVDDEAGDHGFVPRDVVVVECGFDDGVEGPGPDDVVGLRAAGRPGKDSSCGRRLRPSGLGSGVSWTR